MSADRFRQAAKANDSGSWNKYPYTRGDPGNRVDRSGRFDCPPDSNTSVCVSDGEGGGDGGFGYCDVNPGDPSCGGEGIGTDGEGDAGEPSGAAYAGFSQALASLKPGSDCLSQIAGSSGLNAEQLIADLKGAAVTTGSSSPGNGPVTFSTNADGTYNYRWQWAYTTGGNIQLNSNFFPDPTQQNIKDPNGTTVSFLFLINQALSQNLNATEFGTLVFLHELAHIADSGNENISTIDTNKFNNDLVTKCIKH
jgi:hypothetical protein